MTTIQEIQSKRKGAIYKVVIKSTSNFLKKGKESNLTKETTMCIRLGVKRGNMQNVLAQFPNYQNEIHELPWGTWRIANLIITHNNNDYVKCYKFDNMKPKTIYKLDNQVVDRQWLIDNKYISSSEKTYNGIGDLIVKLENLTFI